MPALFLSKEIIKRLNKGTQDHIMAYDGSDNLVDNLNTLMPIRESYRIDEEDGSYKYEADEHNEWDDDSIYGWKYQYKSAIFMPKEAVRLWLRPLSVREVKYNDLTEEDLKLLHFKDHKAFIVNWVKMVPKHMRRELGLKTNPTIFIVKIEVVKGLTTD